MANRFDRSLVSSRHASLGRKSSRESRWNARYSVDRPNGSDVRYRTVGRRFEKPLRRDVCSLVHLLRAGIENVFAS